MISGEESHLLNNKNLVTRELGIYRDEEAEIHRDDVVEEDIFLLCSDGLFAMIEHEEMRMTLLTLKANLELAAQLLIQAANDAGGHGNVSVILVRIAKSFAASDGSGSLKRWLIARTYARSLQPRCRSWSYDLLPSSRRLAATILRTSQ